MQIEFVRVACMLLRLITVFPFPWQDYALSEREIQVLHTTHELAWQEMPPLPSGTSQEWKPKWDPLLTWQNRLAVQVLFSLHNNSKESHRFRSVWHMFNTYL